MGIFCFHSHGAGMSLDLPLCIPGAQFDCATEFATKFPTELCIKSYTKKIWTCLKIQQETR